MPANVLVSSTGVLWNLREGHEDSQYLGQPNERFSFGITKREQFAMNAPDAPTWFKHHLHKADLLYRQAESAGIAEGGSYLFFAWRTYYADKLLAELERTK